MKGGKRSGLPKIHEIELEHQGGLRIEAHGHKPPTGAGTRTATGVCVIEPGQFPYCPICLREDIPAATMEHIPPKAFGGVAMAYTCADCNNRLGSRTEAASRIGTTERSEHTSRRTQARSPSVTTGFSCSPPRAASS
ncbi:MAG: HNH endonuclease [Pseudonocardiaceae bacterium]